MKTKKIEKKANKQLETEVLEYAESIINTVREPLLVLDHDLRVIKVSRSFYEFFKVKPKDTKGKLVYDLGNKQWNIPKLRELLENILPQKTTFDDYEVEHDFATIGRRVMLLNARQIQRALGKKRIILLAIEDITDRKRMESQREAALEALRAKNEELERFIYSVSHDLKSPLVTIRTFLGQLEKDMAAQDKEKLKEDIDYIGIGAEKMSRLLDELLNLSRIGRKPNPPDDISLQSLVQEASALVAGRLTEHNVEVNITKAELMLHGDKTRLIEVFQNLLDNACKFMGKQKAPLIKIGVESNGDETIIFVSDNGMGIDPQFLPKIFNVFEKLDTSIEGTGIGLALVKRIVEMHGGRIWVESAGPGQGTTFKFILKGKQ